MSALPQKPPTDPRKIKKPLESHTAREAFEILAARIILANQQTREVPSSRLSASASVITLRALFTQQKSKIVPATSTTSFVVSPFIPPATTLVSFLVGCFGSTWDMLLRFLLVSW